MFYQDGEEWVHVPISYLSRLALADVISGKPEVPSPIRCVGERLMDHFLNDNTSPETCSFYIIKLHPNTKLVGQLGKKRADGFFSAIC